jgi:hypothetical protein
MKNMSEFDFIIPTEVTVHGNSCLEYLQPHPPPPPPPGHHPSTSLGHVFHHVVQTCRTLNPVATSYYRQGGGGRGRK